MFKQGIVGGSDIACLLDANPWKSAIELFYQAVGFTPESFMINEKMVWGTELEDNIGEMYRYFDLETEDLTENYKLGLKVNPVRNVNAIITNDKYPYLLANIDKYLADIDGIGEIKNMNGFVLDAYKEPNTHLLFVNCPAGVPVGYYAQLQQYMMVFEKDRGRFIFLRDGSELIVHDIVKDEYLQEKIAEVSLDFHTRVIKGIEVMEKYPDDKTKQIQLLSAIEPPITDQDCYNSFRTQQILERDQLDKEATMMGGQEMLDKALAYTDANMSEKEAKGVKTEMGNYLKTEMFKNNVHTLDFGLNGKVGMKSRLSVKVKSNEELDG